MTPIPLRQMMIRPVEWQEGSDVNHHGVRDLYNHQKVMYTPHTLIQKDSDGNVIHQQNVTIDKTLFIDL
ncbi:hypothetical protein HR060_00305 [Catenovulum sp. SM1970]|uniref:hypothetical protein n=1 Tax=Marinifaba aquimaris TaxID=2741323 RepID=UPI001572625E|nr:hypothetical protein [Marinifaba aquimaris]NTS75290.1 hypothetical protein [Marinifaba aquimaris]